MKCADCEAAGYEHDELKQMILDSHYWTGLLICGFTWFKRGRFHKDIAKWYEMGLKAGFTRYLLLWPRGHLKTTHIISILVNRILNDQPTTDLIDIFNHGLKLLNKSLLEQPLRLSVLKQP